MSHDYPKFPASWGEGMETKALFGDRSNFKVKLRKQERCSLEARFRNRRNSGHEIVFISLFFFTSFRARFDGSSSVSRGDSISIQDWQRNHGTSQQNVMQYIALTVDVLSRFCRLIMCLLPCQLYKITCGSISNIFPVSQIKICP